MNATMAEHLIDLFRDLRSRIDDAEVIAHCDRALHDLEDPARLSGRESVILIDTASTLHAFAQRVDRRRRRVARVRLSRS
jgi:hypothetical protein